MGAPRLNPGTSHLELGGFELFLSTSVNFLVCNIGKCPCMLSLLCKTTRKRVVTMRV